MDNILPVGVGDMLLFKEKYLNAFEQFQKINKNSPNYLECLLKSAVC